MKQFESFALDTANECLWRGGKQIALPPKPFAVLRYLVENPARLITHDELLDALWPDTFVQPQVLRTYVLDLRKVLGDDAEKPRFIQTLPKRGYCFVSPVSGGQGTSAAGADAGATAVEIIGRDEELASLMQHVQSLAQGQRRLVFVTGEAGIGKTALVESFYTRIASSLPFTVACAQCVEGFAAKEEYYPVMEALAQLCAAPDGERACRILARLSPGWLSAVRRSSETVIATDIKPMPARMPGDVCVALEEIAAEKPLVLIFEDLNWADESTLHLISALARRRGRTGLMVLATYRPQDMDADHPLTALKQDLTMRRLCSEIALTPLAKTAVQTLLSRELKQEAPPDLTSFVYQRSDGNPLFAIALLEHLLAQRTLVREETDGKPHWKQRVPFSDMEAGVPDGLAQMIELAIARLAPADQRLLEAGSLLSTAFPAWAVAAALGEGAAEIEEACDSLARRLYFLDCAGYDELPNGERSAFYVFAHGLYREVLYQRQAATRRANRHIRVAERLGELFAGREANVASEMAFHYEAAGSWLRAVHALRSAIRHAQQRHAYGEATELLEHTLRIVDNLSDPEGVAAAQEIRSELALVRETLIHGGTQLLDTAGKV